MAVAHRRAGRASSRRSGRSNRRRTHGLVDLDRCSASPSLRSGGVLGCGQGGGLHDGGLLPLVRRVPALGRRRPHDGPGLSALAPIRDAVKAAFDQVVLVLSRMTWLGFVTTASMIAGLVAGWRMLLLTAVGLFCIGLLGVWEAAIETIALTVAVSLALVGIPFGIWASLAEVQALSSVPSSTRCRRSPRSPTCCRRSCSSASVLPLPDRHPRVLAPPAIRLTALGIRTVPTTSVEVADSFGTTSKQRLRLVQGAAREAIDHARCEPDDHGGAQHRRDRRRRAPGPRAIGARCVAATTSLEVRWSRGSPSCSSRSSWPPRHDGVGVRSRRRTTPLRIGGWIVSRRFQIVAGVTISLAAVS